VESQRRFPAAWHHDRQGREALGDESNTYPRRVSVWNAATGEFITDYLGPAHYGAPEACFDSADHTRWIGGGEQWKLDFDKKTATPSGRTLYHQTKSGQLQNRLMGFYWNFCHENGRTFLIGFGNGQSIYEMSPDGSAKLWAFCGRLNSIAQDPRWTLPKAITDLPAVQAMFQANAAKSNPKASTDTTPFGTWNDTVKFDEKIMGQNLCLLGRQETATNHAAGRGGIPRAGRQILEGDWGYGNPLIRHLQCRPRQSAATAVLLKLKAEGIPAHRAAPNLQPRQGARRAP